MTKKKFKKIVKWDKDGIMKDLIFIWSGFALFTLISFFAMYEYLSHNNAFWVFAIMSLLIIALIRFITFGREVHWEEA